MRLGCFARAQAPSGFLHFVYATDVEKVQQHAEKVQSMKWVHQDASYIPGSTVPALAEFPDDKIRAQKLVQAAHALAGLGQRVVLQVAHDPVAFTKMAHETLKGTTLPISSVLAYEPLSNWARKSPAQVVAAIQHLASFFKGTEHKALNSVDFIQSKTVQALFKQFMDKHPKDHAMLQDSQHMLEKALGLAQFPNGVHISPRFAHDTVMHLGNPQKAAKALLSTKPLLGTNFVERDAHDCNRTDGYEWCEEEKKCMRKSEETCEVVYSTPIASQVCWNGAAAIPPAPTDDKHHGNPSCIAFQPSYSCEEWHFGGWKPNPACPPKPKPQHDHHHHGHGHGHGHGHHHHHHKHHEKKKSCDDE
eukprot:TRINITY_DN33351_c0_g1_i1.p1 TRINITY_DN33351_c0_g1~~TRINITY_DN33351_c0_g1_i1.p1  ORF type:complete len:368 (-),score=47.82 TRINITY_DN33351_c0_g1_i1:18-1100(-)